MSGIFWTTVFTISLGFAFYIYRFISKRQNYWKDRGFHQVASKEAGTFLSAFQKTHITKLDSNVYEILKKENQPFAGYTELTTPMLFIKDLEHVRHILVKDFDHFLDHQHFGLDSWSGKMLFFMRGEPWKELRTKMSPTFTTGKIRRMFSIIENCGQRLVGFLQQEIEKSPTVDFIEAYGKYTVDVISSAAFGLESGAFLEKKSVFEDMGEKLQFKSNFKAIAKFITMAVAPRLAIFLKLAMFDTEATAFFQATIHGAIQHRQNSGQKRDDFLQIMLEARAGQLKAEETELSSFEKEADVGNVVKGKVDLSDDVICAQSILFFLAGFDTTQTLLQFAAYQLAVSPDIQETLAKEVCQSYKKNLNSFTYESINEMEYMDKLVLGKYSGVFQFRIFSSTPQNLSKHSVLIS